MRYCLRLSLAIYIEAIKAFFRGERDLVLPALGIALRTLFRRAADERRRR